MRRFALLLSLSAAACTFNVEPGHGDPADAATAPAIDAAEPAADAAPGQPDAAGGEADAAVPAKACAQPSLLTDDFGGALSNAWGTFGAVTAVAGGLAVAPSGAAGNYAGVESRRSYDLRGQRVWVEVLETTDPGTSAQTFLEAITPENRYLSIVEENGKLFFRSWPGGGQPITYYGSVDYDAVQHRFWQIREQAGAIYFETSADGVSFVTRAQAAAPWDVSLVTLQVGAGCYTAVGAPGIARFDRLNGGGAPSGEWCEVATLGDDFDDGALARVWAANSGPGGCRVEQGGRLLVTPGGANGNYCVAGTGPAFDLVGGSVHVELAQPAPQLGSSVHAVLELRQDQPLAKLQFIQEGGKLILRRLGPATNEDYLTVTFDPVAHRFLRFAEQGGQVRWQVSPDGAAWTTLTTVPAPLDLSAVAVILAAGNYVAPTGAVDSVGFDRLNR